MTPDDDNPMAKALAASHAADVVRLRRGAGALNAAIPSHGVLFGRTLRSGATAPVKVLFRWPGVLMLLDPVGGEIIRESWAATMQRDMPKAVAFMVRQQRGKPLAKARFQPPQGARLVASFWPDGVVRVHAAKGGELLAESEPGQPTVLRAGFHSLTEQDLVPRVTWWRQTQLENR